MLYVDGRTYTVTIWQLLHFQLIRNFITKFAVDVKYATMITGDSSSVPAAVSLDAPRRCHSKPSKALGYPSMG